MDSFIHSFQMEKQKIKFLFVFSIIFFFNCRQVPSKQVPTFVQSDFTACSEEKECYQWDFLTNLTKDAHLPGRDGAGLLSFHDTLWLLGGWNPTVKNGQFINNTTNEVLYSSDGLKWNSILNPIPWEQRHSAGYLIFKDKMWIIGGDANQHHYQNNVWNSSDGKTWDKISDTIPWGNRVLHYSAVFKGRMWVIGGQTIKKFTAATSFFNRVQDTFFNDIWSSEDGTIWQKMSDSALLKPRGAIVGSVIFNDKLWIIGGGHYQKEWDNDVWSSDDGVKWTFVGEAPWQGRVYNNTFVFDNKIWVFGGHNGKEDLNDCWYSKDGIKWHELKNMNIKQRHAAAVTQYKNCLYVMAGSTVDSLDVWRVSRQ